MKDTFTICKHCGSKLCYEQQVEENVFTWLCLSCGFTTNTYLTEGSEAVMMVQNSAPELYKALLFKDDEERIWMPSTITLPERGMAFIDGTSVEDWHWKAVPAVLITEEDRKEKTYPENQNYRMDMKNGKSYNKNSFSQALDLIGFFNQD